MSLIHQKLYLTENASSVNMSVYIRELVGYLKDSFKTDNAIHFNLNIEPIELDVSIAIPIGLILNEAITNSIKYAFNKPGGEITIAFVNKGLYCFLTIADNGIGFLTNLPQNEPATSLGMTLMKGLCKEIKAEFNIENNGGTIIAMKFSGENLKHS
jgi:two-component sensor histidine kinase